MFPFLSPTLTHPYKAARKESRHASSKLHVPLNEYDSNGPNRNRRRSLTLGSRSRTRSVPPILATQLEIRFGERFDRTYRSGSFVEVELSGRAARTFTRPRHPPGVGRRRSLARDRGHDCL